MDYKDKYNASLELAADYRNAYLEEGRVEEVEVLEEIFTELKESDEDEKIRKELLEHCINRMDGKQVCVDAGDYRRWADWLFRIGKENTSNVKSDEVIRNEIIKFLELPHPQFVGKRHQEEWVAWLEKQRDKDKLIKELGEYKVKYTQDVLEKHLNSMNNKDDERLRKTTIAFLKDFAEQGYENAVECIDWLEKQGERPKGKSALELWKDMRFEVGAQASGNRHEPPMSDNDTKLFSLNDIDEIMEKITEKQSGEIYSDKSALEATNEVKVDNQNCVKPADEVEPKFKVGDWIVFNNKHQSIYQVEKIEDGYYILRHTYGGTFRVCVLHDENLRLWTVQDAKEGDVLSIVDDENRPFIYKGCLDPNHPDSPVAYCGLNTVNHFQIGGNKHNHWWTDEKVQPATKEQRDLLFQKMKEEGYEWNGKEVVPIKDTIIN